MEGKIITSGRKIASCGSEILSNLYLPQGFVIITMFAHVLKFKHLTEIVRKFLTGKRGGGQSPSPDSERKIFMGLFQQYGYAVIIGCSRLGASLADSMSDQDIKVLVMDKDRGAFRKLSSSFGGLTVEGDGTDLDALQDAKVDEAQVVVVVTNNDNTNIMIAQLCREMFNVPRVITRLYNPELEPIYAGSGIDVVCPAKLSADQIDSILEEKPAFGNDNGSKEAI